MPFTHLHVHSDASKIDGLGTVDRLVREASRLGFNALALTDHGTLGNSISFSLACKRNKIKALQGMEAYVTDGGERYHLSLLADGSRGFNTLIDLNNIAQAGEDVKPSFPLSDLLTHNEGLIILTGCPSSPFQKLPYPDAKRLLESFKAILPNRLFAEVQFIAASSKPWERAFQLSKDLHLPPIVTNDVHFPLVTDALAHQDLTKLKASFTYDSANLFLATEDEMRARVRALDPAFLPLLEKGMRNSGILASKLEEIHFESKPRLPEIEGADRLIIEKCYAGLDRKGLHTADLVGTKYRARLEHELSIIDSLGFNGYFLILEDILNFARSHSVKIGPGRGSGAGSLVCYLLGITEIDPIKYGLSFERFLNHKRAEMPDIDSDIASNGREIVINYAKEKWGALPIATYSRYSHKSLIHDLARIYHIDKKTDEEAADSEVGSAAWDRFGSKAPNASNTYRAMLGQIRHMGQHAGGVVIVDKDTHLPLEKTSNGDLVVAWTEGEHRELSLAGMVKFDLLGLTALDVLDRLEREFPGVRPDEPTDDHSVFKMFRDGDTAGIFQFSGSPGIVEFTKRVAPTKFIDLVIINALYRPGSLDAGTATHFPEWRKSPRKIHSLIDPILEETAGIIVFQEQLMEVYAKVTGVEMVDADIVRKILVKSQPGNFEWEEKLAKLRKDFLDGWMIRVGDEKLGIDFWSEIQSWARYGFNKSHSVCYSYLAWCLAWYKYNYPLQFYAATLSTDRNSWETILYDLISNGYSIKEPSVQYSTGDFVAKDGVLYLPLNIVKNLGDKGIKEITKNQPFSSLEDFMGRISKKQLPKRARMGLWQLGAFGGLSGDSEILDLDYTEIIGTLEERQKEYLGFIIVSKDTIEKINQAKSSGYLAGIVKSREVKKSDYGQYIRWNILPEGSCWYRGVDYDMEVGNMVKCKVDKKNNRLLKVVPL